MLLSNVLNNDYLFKDVVDDVLGALNAGIKGILVKTGKYKTGDETKIKPKPTAVVPNFPEAVETILSQMKK